MNRARRHRSLPNESSCVCQLDEPSDEIGFTQRKQVRYNLRNRDIFDGSDSKGAASESRAMKRPNNKNDSPIDSIKKPETGSDCGMQKLPNEMLFIIFTYLPVKDLCRSVAPVCKLWNELAKSPVLWKKHDFLGNEVSTEDTKRLLAKSPYLQKLSISARSDVEELLSQVCKSNRDVSTIIVKKCDWLTIRAACLNRLLRRCQKIHYLTLKDVNIRSGKFFANLGVALPNLTHLHLSYSNFLNPGHVSNIATRCSNLVRLWLSGEIRCGSGDEWNKSYVAVFQQCGRNLTHLQIDVSKINDENLKDLSLCKQLKVLHLHNAVNLHYEGLAAIGSLCNLIALRLHKATRLCSLVFATLFSKGNMKNLAYLSIAACCFMTNDCAETIIRHCPELHALSLALVDGITDAGVETIVKYCKSLHYLDMFCMNRVTGSVFEFVSKYESNLSLIVVEEMCTKEKNGFIRLLKASGNKINIYQTHVWKTGARYNCKLLS